MSTAPLHATVYTKPACIQCESTYTALTKYGIPFTVVDVSTDDAARDTVLALGYRQTPVVILGEDHWSGFKPDRMKAAVKNHQAAASS